MFRPVVDNLKRLVVWTVAFALSAASTGVVWLKGSGQTISEVALALF